MWWGLRCAFTFLGDLLLSDGMGDSGGQWTVEKRFRVTEVFLAIVWVRSSIISFILSDHGCRGRLRQTPVFGFRVPFVFFYRLSHVQVVSPQPLV